MIKLRDILKQLAQLTLIFGFIALSYTVNAKSQLLKSIWTPYFKYHSVDNGMSQSFATVMIQDENEFVWIVTPVGVDRFNGYEFQTIMFDEAAKNNPQANVVSLLMDEKKRIVAVTEQGGVFIYSPETQQFSSFYQSSADVKVKAAHIIANNQLMIFGNNGFQLLDLKTESPTTLLSGFGELGGITDVLRIYAENKNLLWISTSNEELYSFHLPTKELVNHNFVSEETQKLSKKLVFTPANDGGVFAFLKTGELYKVTHSQRLAQKVSFANDRALEKKAIIMAMIQTSDQFLWVTTQGEGLIQIDLDTRSTRQFKMQNTKLGGISSNNLYGIFFDSQDQLWAAAPNGLNYAQVENTRFYQIGGNRAYAAPLKSLSIFNIVGDSTDNIWVGTHDAGICRMNPEELSTYSTSPQNTATEKLEPQQSKIPLKKTFVTALALESDQTVWVGYPDSIKLYHANTAEILPVDNHWQKIAEKGIAAIHIDRQDKLITTIDNDIYFQPNGGAILNISNPVNANRNDLKNVVGPVNGSYWISSASTGQVLEFNKNTQQITQHVIYDRNDFRVSEINALWVSPEKELWVGTRRNGIARKNLDTLEVNWLDTSSGLFDNYVYTILGDGRGNVWVTGNNGMTRVSSDTSVTHHFTVDDGLQSNEFNTNSSFRSHEGLLFFGGINGITVVDEDTFSISQHVPKTYIQEATLLTTQGSRKLRILDSTSIEPLDYRSNSLSFKIGAVNLLNPEGNTFSYRLIGNNLGWVDLGSNRNINFLNLSAGDYQLEVMSCNSDMVCNSVPQTVKFRIPPPPWLSIWAYFVYSLILVLIVMRFIKRQQDKIRYQQEVAENERKISNELRELNSLKDQFLTNTSHELRTPLNGIIGLSHMLTLDAENLSSEDSIESLEAINQCGIQLKSLVDELLDYSQLNVKRLILKRDLFDVNRSIEQIVLLTQPQCAKQKLTLTTELTSGPLMVYADENRIRQVIYNLLNNAIKFSDTGTITISAHPESDHVKVVVQDQGVGIPKELHQKIFLSFTQADGGSTRNHGGVGLGLAISKDIIELHGYQLELESAEGKGSKFSFYLPIQKTT